MCSLFSQFRSGACRDFFSGGYTNFRSLLLVTVSLCLPRIVLAQSSISGTAARSHVERFSAPQMVAERDETEETAKLATNPNKAEVLNSRAHARIRLGHYNEAYEDLSRAVTLKPESAE